MKFGLTQQFCCSYLPEKHEQLLVFVDAAGSSVAASQGHYDLLLDAGFRRSGEQIYRPHCPACQACQAIRIPVQKFVPSKSQQRVLRKNRDILVQLSFEERASYYSLYEQYINQRHHDGSMFPATRQQYDSFIKCAWNAPVFLEFYLQEELVAVAVTDLLGHALSALYTFFRPDLAERSIGTFAILQQIKQAQNMHKSYLYLGYQIDKCQKMNYKSKFLPHERFYQNKWHLITKKPA